MDRLNDVIRNEKCVYFCRGKCGFCDMTDEFFLHRGLPCKKLFIEDHPYVAQPLVEKTGISTVPNIFINGVPVGGYQQLAEYYQRCLKMAKSEAQADVVCAYLLNKKGA